MARYYTSGTLSAQTNYAKAVRLAMHTGFTAAIAAGKSTWSITDHSYTNGTSERTVFNCSDGTDFAIMVVNSTTAGVNTFNNYIGASYTVGTHVLEKVGHGLASTQLSGADGLSTTTLNPTAVSTSTSTMAGSNYVTIPATSTTWFLTVDDDYAVFALKDGTAGIGTVWYFGAFESSVTNTSLTDSSPYCLTVNGSNNGSVNGAVILHSLNNQNKTIVHSGLIATQAAVSTLLANETGRPSAAAIYDVYKAGTKTVLSTVNLYRQSLSLLGATNPHTDGHKRGVLKGIAYASPTGSAWGDEIDVNGVTYIYGGGIGNLGHGTAGSTSNMSWWVAIN
jgi:hypothetical protein